MKSVGVVVLSTLIGALIGTAIFGGLYISRGDPLKRYGLPKGYPQPVNVRNWNKETIAILWPDGHLESRADKEIVIRTLIDQRIELEKQAREVLGAAREQALKMRGAETEIKSLNMKLSDALKAENELRAMLQKGRRSDESDRLNGSD